MSKYQYSFYGFLMMRSSGERLIAGMVEKGFSVEPTLKDSKAYYTGDVSTLVCLSLTHTEKDYDKVYDIISSLIKDKDIPIFGYVLTFSNGGAKFYCGHMPAKKAKVVEQGPYRTSGDIIPFPKKDDGIIDDKPKA